MVDSFKTNLLYSVYNLKIIVLVKNTNDAIAKIYYTSSKFYNIIMYLLK